MVCDTCEEKLSKLVVPDKWKDGARNTVGGKSGGQKVGQNVLVSKKSKDNRFTPMERSCRICKCKVAQKAHYCQQCAYKKGICAMCGRKIVDTKGYKMSS